MANPNRHELYATGDHHAVATVLEPDHPEAGSGDGHDLNIGTDAALPVSRLLPGLCGADGRDDAVNAQHDGSLGTWRDTQLLSWVLSFNSERTYRPLAVTANAAELWLNNVPLRKPAAMAGYVDRRLVLNPTMEEMKHSRLNLTVAGTRSREIGRA